jgi:hypothetical protein
MPSVLDSSNAADRVVFRSAKQDTINTCLTGHTDAEKLIQFRAFSQAASVMLRKQDHETGGGGQFKQVIYGLVLELLDRR